MAEPAKESAVVARRPARPNLRPSMMVLPNSCVAVRNDNSRPASINPPLHLSPLAGRGRVRGPLRESEPVEGAPHPDPLPARGEREKNTRRVHHGCTLLSGMIAPRKLVSVWLALKSLAAESRES